jgi:iron complex transport system ATP-binding protein
VEKKKLSVLLVLHDLNLASLYSDRIALIVHGQLKMVDLPDKVLTESNLNEVYNVPVNVIPHPIYGVPLILPDGRMN